MGCGGFWSSVTRWHPPLASSVIFGEYLTSLSVSPSLKWEWWYLPHNEMRSYMKQYEQCSLKALCGWWHYIFICPLLFIFPMEGFQLCPDMHLYRGGQWVFVHVQVTEESDFRSKNLWIQNPSELLVLVSYFPSFASLHDIYILSCVGINWKGLDFLWS